MTRSRSERYICTKENPWSEDKGTPASHPDAEFTDDTYDDFGGGWDHYKCPHCGLHFKVEIAQ
jgi:hypothetical protein